MPSNRLICSLMSIALNIGGLSLAVRTNVAYADQSPTVKVAVVDLNQAMNEVEEGKAATASLEKKYNERLAALQKKQKDFQALQDEFEKKSMVMSDEAKKNKARELQEKYQDLQQSKLEADQELQGMRQQMQDDLAEKLKKVCASIAQKDGYTLVVEKAVVWYSAPQYDITSEVIKAYNAQKPTVKPAGAVPKK